MVIFQGYASYQAPPRSPSWQPDNLPLNLESGAVPGVAAGQGAQAQAAGVGIFKDENDG